MIRTWACLQVVLVAIVGCSRKQRDEDFIPREEVGRSALEAYLRAWSEGQIDPSVAGANPPVSVVDELRQKGRVLKSYTILGPVPTEAPLCFAVQLMLGNPDEQLRERYVVVGFDPLWVWRYDDYLMITHWSHPNHTESSSTSPKR